MSSSGADKQRSFTGPWPAQAQPRSPTCQNRQESGRGDTEKSCDCHRSRHGLLGLEQLCLLAPHHLLRGQTLFMMLSHQGSQKHIEFGESLWLPSGVRHLVSTATPTLGVDCEQNTLTRHIFLCLHACLTVSHVTLAQVLVRVIPSMFHALVCLTSLRLSTSCTLYSLSHPLLHPPDLHLHLLCGSVRREFP